MKKVLYSLLAFSVMSFGLAGSFGVFYQGPESTPISVDYELDSNYRVSPTLGVDFDYVTRSLDATLGASVFLAGVEGADIDLVSRLVVPVYDGTAFGLGQLSTATGVSLTPTGQGGVLTPVFEFGVDYDLTWESLTGVPGLYFRVGVRW